MIHRIGRSLIVNRVLSNSISEVESSQIVPRPGRSNESIRTRPAIESDAQDIAQLLYLSSPEFFSATFGESFANQLEDLCRRSSTLFGFPFVRVAHDDGVIEGVALAYDAATKSSLSIPTGRALAQVLGLRFFTHLPRMLKTNSAVGALDPGQFYLSNLAVHPKSRGRGVGRRLVEACRQDAIASGAKDLVLDVEQNNLGAIRLYERLGFQLAKSSPPIRLGTQTFSWHRLSLSTE